MPSHPEKMRRTTRVFGARVLRSGKRCWTGPVELKYTKPPNNEPLIELLQNSIDIGGNATDCKEHRWPQRDASQKQEVMEMDAEGKVVECESEKVKREGSVVDNNVIRRWGVVYTRKRKKVGSNLDSSNNGEKKSNSDDKRFGKQFFRKHWRKRIRLSVEVAEAHESNVGSTVPKGLTKILVMIVEPSCTSPSLVTSFLNSVLGYMRKAIIELRQISSFLHYKTIAHVYSSHGIHFQQDSNFIPVRGICMITGARCFIPQFVVDFSALPFCFIYLHSCMLFQSLRLSCVLGVLIGIDKRYVGMTKSCIHSERTQAADVMVTSENDCSGKTVMSHSNVVTAEVGNGNVQLRNGCNNQKRSSLRSKRGRPPSALGARKANEPLASNLFSSRQNGIQLPPITSDPELKSSDQRNNSISMKEVKSALAGLTQDVDSTSCFANILVMESDRCYREEGAMIMLEISVKRQWYLAIKRDGTKQYSLIAQKLMRPCSCNRFTHAIIWTADSGWKLEFPDRQDWLIFKELYKECSDRNVRVPAESFIPVPGVHDVPFLGNSSNIFVRPTSYITVKDDELSRALAKRTANYDMDSDDEGWVNKFNNDFYTENESHKLLSTEIFEGIIDSFERGFHCNPDDYTRKTSAPAICINVERRVVEAVFSYWIKKRRQERSALVRVFQFYQPRRTQLIPKSVLRKKRSFKQKRNQVGRGKQPPLVQAEQPDALGQQKNAILKVEEAKAAANRSEGLAVLKRQRAQQLMKNADLATYKAKIALRVAELEHIVVLQDSIDHSV